MNLKVKSNKYNIEIPLKRRVTILRGDSGSGKTSLINIISIWLENGTNEELDVICDLNIIICRRNDYLKDIADAVDSLIIIDDMGNKELSKIGELVMKTQDKGNYMLIINREDIGALSYAVPSILRVERNGVEHKVSEMYTVNEIDCVVCGTKEKKV